MNGISLPHDIYGPVVLSDSSSWPMVLLFVLLAVFIILAVIYWFKRRNQATKLTLQEETLQRLRELHSKKHADTALLWISEASLILRGYIENRFSLRTTRQTTREFLHSKELGELPALKQFQGELRRCLELSDLVKFARMQPSGEQLDQIEHAIEDFVTKTTPEDPRKTKGGRK